MQIIEAIQSRCAILRYTKLSDAEVLERLLEVVEAEKVAATDDGLEALVFTAQGDMRQVGVLIPSRSSFHASITVPLSLSESVSACQLRLCLVVSLMLWECKLKVRLCRCASHNNGAHLHRNANRH